MARMNSASYEKLRSLSRGNFLPQQFLKLKELAANTVGVNNSIFDVELNSLLSLPSSYYSCRKEYHILRYISLEFLICVSAFLNWNVNKTDVNSTAIISAIGSAMYTPIVGLDTM